MRLSTVRMEASRGDDSMGSSAEGISATATGLAGLVTSNTIMPPRSPCRVRA